MAVAVNYSSKSTTETEGGTGESTGDLSPSVVGLTYSRWYDVLNNTRGVVAQTISGEPARWCSATSNTRDEWLGHWAGSRLFPG